jgi:hypothetical protein
MLKRLFVLFALTALTAFAQMPKIPSSGSSGNPSTPAANPGAPDTGNSDTTQIKSIDQVLHDYPKFSDKLKALLPSGTTPQQACSGFKTLDQCVATIHVAQNLKLPLADLKAKTTGKGSISLQKAIEQLAPAVNAKEETKKAKKQASEDMKGVSLFSALLLGKPTIS